LKDSIKRKINENKEKIIKNENSMDYLIIKANTIKKNK
jgi:hypothetical protein